MKCSGGGDNVRGERKRKRDENVNPTINTMTSHTTTAAREKNNNKQTLTIGTRDFIAFTAARRQKTQK